VVFIDRFVEDAQADTVTVQNETGAFAAVSHLVEQGHERVALIGGRDQLSTARERKQGYLRALDAAGISPQPELMRGGDFRHSGGYRAMHELLDLPCPPTAVFVVNNLMALGALQAIHESGKRIPSDIAIVGFDDMLWATSLNPPLTTVSQPAKEIGQMAAELLVGRIKDPNRAPRQVILQTHLNVRASSVVNYK
jgi:DNA-binding LacI/PurR family transcriptional regulator